MNSYLNIIGKKHIYFIISLLVIIPGLISLALWGLRLSIDFTSGTEITLLFPKTVTQDTKNKVSLVFKEAGTPVSTLQTSGKSLIVKVPSISQKKDAEILSKLKPVVGEFKQDEFETIGPTVGKEITFNAFKAVFLAAILIVLYIAFSFRKVPKPASSWRFGVTAIVAMLHDVLVVVGIFSILGHFLGVEVDSLFVTAVLTVVGFSVHDTIVVFDRIRENLQRVSGVSFDQVVNDSILQTMTRSLNTSLTAMLVLFTLLIFGGESTRWFVLALLIGIASGTYSSIFNASPLLVVWHDWSLKHPRKTKTASQKSKKKSWEK